MILEMPQADEAASLTYLAWLSYPGQNEAQRRDTLMRASIFYIHRRKGIAPRHMPAPLRDLKPKRVKATIEAAGRQIFHRRVAAVTAWLRQMEQRRGVASVTNPDGIEVAVNGADDITEAADMWRQMFYNRNLPAKNVADLDGSDFRARTWRPSLPVLPMAVAFVFSAQSILVLTDRLTGDADLNAGDVRIDGPIQLGLTELILSPGWVREAVSVAQAVADTRDPTIIFPTF